MNQITDKMAELGIQLPGVFQGQEVYTTPTWEVEGKPRAFSEQEVAVIDHVEIVAGKYGLSACFFVKGTNGKHFYMDVDKQSSLAVGDQPDIRNLLIKKLVNKYDPSLPKQTLRVLEKPVEEDQHPTNFDNPFNL